MDALLGAAALGDIGKHFPDNDDRYKGISSLELLRQVGKLLDEKNYVIENIDATIIAQKPKMRPYIDEMRKNIADTLKLDIDRVNVKATTEEGLGFTGKKEGISAHAFCPVGQKVVIDCKGLQIGSYRKLAQIGSIYEGKVGRMPEYVWKQHVRLINEPKLFYDELRPLEISTAAELTAVDMKQAPLLVTLKNVSFPDANGTTTYAAEEDVANPNLSFVERNINYADGTKSAAVAHTSIYANFSKDVLPQGTLNVTGILTRYNNAWQLIIRTGSDVKRNK